MLRTRSGNDSCLYALRPFEGRLRDSWTWSIAYALPLLALRVCMTKERDQNSRAFPKDWVENFATPDLLGVYIWSLELFALEPQLSFIAALRLITSTIAISIQSCGSLLQATQLWQFALFRSPALVCGLLWHLQGAQCWHIATRAFCKCSLLVREQLQYLRRNLAFQVLDSLVYKAWCIRMMLRGWWHSLPSLRGWSDASKVYTWEGGCVISLLLNAHQKRVSCLQCSTYWNWKILYIVTTHCEKAIGCADVQVREHNNNN